MIGKYTSHITQKYLCQTSNKKHNLKNKLEKEINHIQKCYENLGEDMADYQGNLGGWRGCGVRGSQRQTFD